MSSRSRMATSPLRDLALNIQKSSLTVADECLRFRYEESPDLVARMASRGELDYPEVLSMVRDLLEGRTSVPEARAALDPYALWSLARLMIGLRTPVRDFSEPADIARAVRLLRGSIRLPWDAAMGEGQANLAVGNFDHVARVLADDLEPDTRWILTTELAHPAHGRPGATEEAWLKAFNQRFADQGLLPVRIPDGPGAPFDRIAVDVPESLVVDDPDSPLVTIIMSTYKPDHSFPTAVASLVAQTWRNLEILVVDDCSPPEFDDLLETVTATDPRIRLMRMPVNGGTYKIRNHAIAQSRGAFVTFQDSDDWAHPQRIERQVTPLIESHDLVATSARALRVYADMTSLTVGYNSFRRGEASLMFRKDVVIDTLGSFHETRKAADTEFFERIDTVFGAENNVWLPDVLVLTQLTAGSLSRDEFSFGWHHGARTVYGEARRFWHRQIAAGLASPYLPPGDMSTIYAPDRMMTGRSAEPATCDVLWLSDWRQGIDRYVDACAQVETLIENGLSTLVAHGTTVRHADRKRLPIRDDIQQLQLDGLTRFAVWGEAVHARLLLVTDPELPVMTRPPETVSMSADRLVIAAGHPPAAPTGDWLTYDPASVERNAKRMFGVEPSWLPAHDGIADDLRSCGATGTILPPHQIRAVPTVRPRPYTGHRGGSRLIVGTTALALPRRDRPSWASLRRLLPQDDDYDVRLRAEPEVVEAVLKHRPVPPGWLVMPETTPILGFMRQLDVFVAVPSRSWGPELPWSVVAALAEGAVVVIDPAYQRHLGGAAVFASAVDVHDELKALAADPDRLAEQRERGYAYCRKELSEDSFVAMIDELAGFERTGR